MAETAVDSEENIHKIHDFVENSGSENDIETMNKMLKEKIISNVNVRDSTMNNATALMYQAYNGTIDGMKFLLSNGADVNLQDSNGQTAVRYAVRSREQNKLKLLSDHGANITKDDVFGNWNMSRNMSREPSPMDYNKKKSSTAGSSSSREATIPAVDSTDNIKIFVRRNPGDIDTSLTMLDDRTISDINIRDSGLLNCTLLMYQAYHGSAESMKPLLERGANVNLQDKYGDTALHYAINNGQDESDKVELLLRYGADRTIKGNNDYTALDIAKQKQNKNKKCILVLENSELLGGARRNKSRKSKKSNKSKKSKKSRKSKKSKKSRKSRK
jgi:ankyrin repeat protein